MCLNAQTYFSINLSGFANNIRMDVDTAHLFPDEPLPWNHEISLREVSRAPKNHQRLLRTLLDDMGLRVIVEWEFAKRMPGGCGKRWRADMGVYRNRDDEHPSFIIEIDGMYSNYSKRGGMSRHRHPKGLLVQYERDIHAAVLGLVTLRTNNTKKSEEIALAGLKQLLGR